jgi:hypothetical protein
MKKLILSAALAAALTSTAFAQSAGEQTGVNSMLGIALRQRATVEHSFGTMKARMGATHFLIKTLPKVAAEMALLFWLTI